MIKSEEMEWRWCSCSRKFPANKNENKTKCPSCRLNSKQKPRLPVVLLTLTSRIARP